ncbi:ABC transporter substrate-binding protein (plasmid) [Rhizobium tumorigenes]|uniref:ABC transporter substrate-binding protein n=2 Tax=Rhizobium tumorigenes TaxID=2041385 RepID=A0AAF1KB23_9HYPH|nr:ABC transporter substrate-binding protein [Rhizobium tumorigenes]WFR98885.1 ABC transporter substrate-binding protein [Rhizobium tumorigenes]
MALLTTSVFAEDAKVLKSVGISVGSLGNPFYVAAVAGITAAAKKANPDVKITAVDADYDLNKQLSQIDSFIGAGTDIMMIVPVDPKASVPAVQKAKAGGMVVAAFDTTASNADVSVSTDNVKAGENACEYLADKLGGKGNIVFLNAVQVSAVVDRINGCKSVLAKHPDMKVVADQNTQGSRDGGLKVMQSILTAQDHIDGVFAANDPAAIGGDLAAKQMKRNEFIITSVDGAPDVEKLLKGGNTLIKATASQDPYAMAAQSFDLALAIFQGKKPAETKVLLDPKLITADNIADYKGWTSAR